MSSSSSPAPLTTNKAALAAAISALPGGIPSAAQLFAFAAEAERRVQTLRLRAEERSVTAAGESVTQTELLVDRPHARVTTIHGGSYDVWATDGSQIEQYSAASNTFTRRPRRAAPAGLDGEGLPSTVAVGETLGPLPSKGWATTLLRPGHFCSNVLSSAVLGDVHETTHLGRAALVVDAAAPRTIDRVGDHAAFRYEVTFDRQTGLLLAVNELHSDQLVRSTAVTALAIDAAIPASEFVVEIPGDAHRIY
jgi:outer membrane lipoprotein-sorting protein